MRYIFAVLLSLSMLPIRAQDTKAGKEETIWQLFKYDAGNIFKGVGHAYSRPLHWQGDQWATFGGVVAGTGLLMIIDDEANEFFENQREGTPQIIRDYGWYYGSPQNNYMATTAVYLTGLFTKNEKLRRTGVLLVSSATAGGVLQQFSKYAFGRARPRSGKNSATYDPWSSDKDFHAFPSGHAMLAFTNAYAIAKQFDNTWVKVGIYTLGSIPGFTRLLEGAHWLSDVAVGMVMSIFIVESIDKYLDAKYDQKYNTSQKKVSWDLQFSPGQIGVAIRF